jgi:Fe-Mn family superoxide dismutase
MSLELPPLPYDYDALAPFMSRETLEYHHDKHHLAYVNAGNTLLKDSPLSSVTIEQICVTAFAEKAAGLINNIGQHFNHIHFWQWMRPGGGGKSLPGRLQRHVDLELGGFDRLRADFVAAGLGQFGSGWCWLSIRDGRLAIMRTPGGETADARLDAAARMRRVGTFLLRRLSESATEISGDMVRQLNQLGSCRAPV